MPLLSEERVYPNEQALIDLVATERVERRRLLDAYHKHSPILGRAPSAALLGELLRSSDMERRRARAYSTHACAMDITERIDDIITDTVPACR